MQTFATLQQSLQTLDAQALDKLKVAKTQAQLAQWHTHFLGRKGQFATSLHGVGGLPPKERPKVGRLVNDIKKSLEQAFKAQQAQVQQENLNQNLASRIDISLPGRPLRQGGLHPSTQELRRVRQVFGEMGFEVYEAPEVETNDLNFNQLNIPPHHPARDMWDTFWVDEEVVLRTHTSPGQIRCMRERHPHPIRVILPGKCYRYEAISARSEHQFFQVEGLAVGRHVRLTDLTGCLHRFLETMYGVGRKLRVRGSYFPFTEPSIEIDMDCILCSAKGCRVCKGTGWLEVAGAGMVHPQVLKNGGYNPNEWSGFAFGMGVERPIMLQRQVEDIRQFHHNDLRFLRQF